MLAVWVTSTGRSGRWAEATEPLLQLAHSALRTPIQGAYQEARSPELADIIVFVEPEYIKLRPYIDVLAAEPLLSRYPERCFVIDCADTAWGFVPGVYTNLRRADADRHRLRANGYLRFHNSLTEDAHTTSGAIARELLYSFQGAPSSEVRRRLFKCLPATGDTLVQRVDRWLDHTRDEHADYLRTIARSRFVLCPAGNAPSSYRLYETMQMGRVPVIISDTWTPSDGPAWPDFSIRIAESRLHELRGVLEGYDERALVMGRAARVAWEDWFSPSRIVSRMLGDIESIMLERPANHDERQHQDWTSWRNLWRCGWTVPQRAVARLRRGLSQ